MAVDLKISITDETSAKLWLEDVKMINDDFHTAMSEAGQELQRAKEFGEGTVVDELYDMGTNFLNAAEKVYNTVNEISTAVNSVLSKVGEFLTDATGILGKVSKLFG